MPDTTAPYLQVRLLLSGTLRFLVKWLTNSLYPRFFMDKLSRGRSPAWDLDSRTSLFSFNFPLHTIAMILVISASHL